MRVKPLRWTLDRQSLRSRKFDFFGRDFRIERSVRESHPFSHLLDQPDTRPCCKDLRALKVGKEQPDLWVATCLGCGSVHYRMRAERGDIGIIGR
jgi:hypothetical protein